jgi:hypothetical protein
VPGSSQAPPILEAADRVDQLILSPQLES